METADQTVFAQHRGDVAMVFEEDSALFEITPKKARCYQGSRHYFGMGHLRLPVLRLAKGFPEVIAHPVDGYATIGYWLLRFDRKFLAQKILSTSRRNLLP